MSLGHIHSPTPFRSNNLDVSKALTLSLGELNQPVVTNYYLGVILATCYQTKVFREEIINGISRKFPSQKDYKKIVANLEQHGVIKHQDAYNIILLKKGYRPLEILCSIDPFLYISHLSAMSFHGLIDRIPDAVYVSSPGQKMWRELAKQKMLNDYGDLYPNFLESQLPRLTKPVIRYIGKYKVNTFSSIHLGSFQYVSDNVLRVSTLGRTFLDMIREPMRCGGMRKVIKIYNKCGGKYKDFIIDEVNQHGNKIEKVRAGYLLEEVCGISEKIIEKWLSYVERGGSRKLDPSTEYRPNYSERWCLSINI